MAADTMGLMDGLGIEKAHVCGASMGGMIAQIMAIIYPERVLSLTSISSSTGNPDIHQNIVKKDEIPLRIPVPVPHERSAYIDYMVDGMRELAGPGFHFDELEVSKLAGELYDRSFYPEGAARQLLAILMTGNRKPALTKITIPTLVIHGDSDPLVPVECGYDTAEAIPRAELLVIKGMGHDLPKEVWPKIVNAIINQAVTPAQ
jgi:pimeloyl-ACP methyl ester carboxylesterase